MQRALSSERTARARRMALPTPLKSRDGRAQPDRAGCGFADSRSLYKKHGREGGHQYYFFTGLQLQRFAPFPLPTFRSLAADDSHHPKVDLSNVPYRKAKTSESGRFQRLNKNKIHKKRLLLLSQTLDQRIKKTKTKCLHGARRI